MNKITLLPAALIVVILFSSLPANGIAANANLDTTFFHSFQIHPSLTQSMMPIESSVEDEETPPNIQWVQQYTANYSADYADRVIQTTDGGFAIAGIIDAHKYSVPVGWLVKTDSLGDVEWNQTFTVVSGNLTYNLESIAGLVETKDGGYVISGTEASFPSDDMAIAPSTFAILLKTDGSGNVLWNRTYSELNGISFMVKTSDGGFALAGDYSLVKTDSKGKEQWQKSYQDNVFKPNDENQNLISITQTTDSGYALLTSDNILFKVNPSGSLQWKQTYQVGTSNYGAPGYINSFIQTSDGGYALEGRTYTSNATDGIVAVIRTDSKGHVQGNSTYGPDGSSGTSLIQASDGGYAFAGTLPRQSNYPSNLVWLVKTDPAGKVQWTQTNNNTAIGFSVYSLGGSFSVSWLIETNDGGFMIAGSWNIGNTFLGTAYYLAKTALSLPAPLPSPTIPEVPSFAIPMLLSVITAVGLLVYFKRHKQNQIPQTSMF